MSTPDPSLERKERNEQFLKALGVPVNLNLPHVESEKVARLKEPNEVAKRAVALYSLVSVAHLADPQGAISWLKNEGLWEAVTLKEKVFLESQNPSQEQINDATWRAECLWTLLWALGRIEKSSLPTELCDTELVQQIMSPVESSCAGFVSHAALRSTSEILDETDLIYRIHWAVVDARLNNKEPPGGFDPGVVYERHYALNWLTCYSDDWDDVTTDT
jgi:hypothetical protein